MIFRDWFLVSLLTQGVCCGMMAGIVCAGVYVNCAGDCMRTYNLWYDSRSRAFRQILWQRITLYDTFSVWDIITSH